VPSAWCQPELYNAPSGTAGAPRPMFDLFRAEARTKAVFEQPERLRSFFFEKKRHGRTRSFWGRPELKTAPSGTGGLRAPRLVPARVDYHTKRYGAPRATGSICFVLKPHKGNIRTARALAQFF
jgi:hypothetical protein